VKKTKRYCSSAWTAYRWTSSNAGPKAGTCHLPASDRHRRRRSSAVHHSADVRTFLVIDRHGHEPGKTGIYDFLYRREGTYAFPPVNASLRGGTTMWRYLSDAGYRVGVLNIPMSYPVEQINGFMISGWMTPYRATDYLYPPELAAELEREIGEYRSIRRKRSPKTAGRAF